MFGFDPHTREQIIWSMVKTLVSWYVLIALAIWQGPKIRDAAGEWMHEALQGKHRTGSIILAVASAAFILYGVITKLSAQPPPAW
ncbi:MAG: hypothetical protein WBM17_04435 [Anaerolineales bacterium]